jgi:general secretion pathway protein A
MSYYRVLGFDKEPFSTSPDPDFFYSSREHDRALTNILIELRLRRGLSVVLGDVGTGKTTLSRKLVQDLREREDCIFHIMLDPSFENRTLFTQSLIKNLNVPMENPQASSITELRDALERFLYQKGVVENKTVVLIIDEAQKLDPMSMEVLRLLLNYETNQFKLLQLVLLGQIELLSTVRGIPNFMDRISFKTTLDPLGFDEMKEMVHFRIKQAGYRARMDLFLEDALKEIHQYTRGYPRQVTMLCHRSLKEMLMKNKSVVDRELVNGIIEEEAQHGWQRTNRLLQNSSY